MDFCVLDILSELCHGASSCYREMNNNRCLLFLRNANVGRDNVRRAQETPASVDSPQWNMTGNFGGKQMMSSGGLVLVLTP